MPPVSTSLLADLLLEGCRGRAAGYLKMALPKEFGGHGLTLAEAGRETRRLATYAPATALCINMHHYWVGTAADAWRTGDKSVEWMLRTLRPAKSSRPGMPRAATKRRCSRRPLRLSAWTAVIR